MDALVFLAVVAFFVVIMFGYVFFKLDDRSWKGLKDYFLYAENGGQGALTGIALAVILTTVIGWVLSALYSVAKADEVKYLQFTEVYAGLEKTFKQSPQCYGGGVDDGLTSSLGVDQHLIGYGQVYVSAGYQHHSCAVNRDHYSYDAVGLKVKWRIE